MFQKFIYFLFCFVLLSSCSSNNSYKIYEKNKINGMENWFIEFKYEDSKIERKISDGGKTESKITSVLYHLY